MRVFKLSNGLEAKLIPNPEITLQINYVYISSFILYFIIFYFVKSYEPIYAAPMAAARDCEARSPS